MLAALVPDIRAGSRIVSRSPRLSATVIVLIGLAIGGNTTIYSFVHSLLVTPAPG